MNLKTSLKRKLSQPSSKSKNEKPGSTILSFFKSPAKNRPTSSVNLLNDVKEIDDDLEIILVEKKSRYFGQTSKKIGKASQSEDCDDEKPHQGSAEDKIPKLRRLSLRKRSSQKIEYFQNALGENEEKVSRKQLREPIQYNEKATEIDNNNVLTRSQKNKHLIPEPSSVTTDSKRRYSLRKGKLKNGLTVNTENVTSQDTDKSASSAESKCQKRKCKKDTSEDEEGNQTDTCNKSKEEKKEFISSSNDHGDGLEIFRNVQGHIIDEVLISEFNEDFDIPEKEVVCESKERNNLPSTYTASPCQSYDSEHKALSPSNQKYSEESHTDVVHTNIPNSVQTIDEKKNRNIKVENEIKYKIPYYLENFQTILSAVLDNEDNKYLFNTNDLEVISLFNSLSDLAKKLYVRLFSRKLSWMSLSKLKYPEIAEDLTEVLQEIISADLAVSDIELTDLPTALNCLPLPELKTLSKTYHLNITGSSKTQIAEMLLKKSKQNTIGTMFGAKSKSLDPQSVMLTRAKKHLGLMFRLQEERRRVFVRVLMLFSVLNSSVDDDAANGGQSQLYQMLLVNMGKVIYPKFKVNKQTQLFLDRDSFLRFETAMQLENDMSVCVEKGNWAGAFEVYKTAKQEYDKLKKQSKLVKWDSSLPSFLRLCSAGSVLVRVLSQGIEILQRQKDYNGAVTLIRKLLNQDIYCSDYRGYWWERLALNLEVHLKKPQQALEVIKKGLIDAHVLVGHRLALYQRADKICNTASLNLQHCLKDFYHEDIVELPKVILEGRTIPHSVPGIKTQFMTADSYLAGDSDDITCCGVEQLVLEHYKKNGFPEGLHAEGSIITILFSFFFWDILFMDIPDAFHSAFQTQPLDFHTEHFYIRRKEAVELKLKEIENSSEEGLHKLMSKVWTDHYGEMCAGMNWDCFSGLEHAQGLVSCIRGEVLAQILRRFVMNPRHTRSGFPDLTLWNTENKVFKICEVKGPGDRLSHKQILWIDFLVKLGVDAEVCHVKAVGAKKLKPVASSN